LQNPNKSIVACVTVHFDDFQCCVPHACASHIIFAVSQLLNLNELVKILVQFTARFFTLREVGLIYECCAKLAFLMVRHGNGPDKVTFSMMQRPSEHVCGK